MLRKKLHMKLKRMRKRLLHYPVQIFLDDYKKYGYTTLELYDRIIAREFEITIKKNK